MLHALAQETGISSEPVGSPDSTQTTVFVSVALLGVIFIVLGAIWLIKHPKRFTNATRLQGIIAPATLAIFFWYLLGMGALTNVLAPAFGVNLQQAGNSVETAAKAQWIFYATSLPILVVWGTLKCIPEIESRFDRSRRLSSINGSQDTPRPARSWMVSVAVAVPAMFVTWCVIIVVGALSTWARTILTDEPVDPIAHATLQMLSDSPINVWTISIVIQATVLAPIVEEIVYRGAIHGGIWRTTRLNGLSIIASSALFALMHLGAAEPEALPVLMTLSVGMSIAYAWSGRIITPILMHMMFNAWNVTMLYATQG